MKKDFYKKIEIPGGVEAEIEGSMLKVKGPEGENSREFNLGLLEFKKEGNTLSIGKKKSTKRDKKLINTFAAHIKNMILGIQKKFEYDLKAVFSHFPMTIEANGHEIIIKNFLGERTPRKTIIPKGAEIEIKGNEIKIFSTDRELAGQAAANLETVTKIRKRDRRIFQDGIFIIKKPGRDEK